MSSDLLNIEKIQNRAARLITGAYRRTSTNALLNELGWTTLHVRRDISTPHLLHKIKRHASNITNRNVRNSKNISLPPNRLSSFKNSFFPTTIRRWNKIPEEVRMEDCVRSFKQAVAQIFDFNIPPSYYSLGNKTDNIFHTRLRLGLSSLTRALEGGLRITPSGGGGGI